MAKSHKQKAAQISLEELLAVLVDVRLANRVILKQVVNSGSLDRILEEALFQRQRLAKLTRSLSETWRRVSSLDDGDEA